ncbi:hypothetical protein EN868_03065 [Mesorhizobium sp. M2D.F.Ca.ET.225.01.1.1]|uniref:hypothetical protein n=1 Tax=unclassified Mesorhizobium TaxID=325217 RepID=UPI000FD48E34|nr:MULTISPECIES: hypothetical protein [unclassified Mesorhizobium]TGP65445.1 hypothetical protein EN869_003070 [Mesorhizobium sp. M2D.F.Ca.ET.226.01.1.1]TGP71924.1 hypothetical protein EN868_03065 [Mesorhizobium sp. M2D.F.Ca.ET.225.01.1.1]
MAYKVVRPFAYGADGIHAVDLVIGDEREDFGSSTAGLVLEKYIELVDGDAVERWHEGDANVATPEDIPEPRRRRK